METPTPTTPTVCINFMGAPGVGKTTVAARVFSELKLRGHTAEWVGEYAKKLVYLKRFEELNNQYMGCVKFIVTDGALAHGLYYNRFNPDNTSDVTKTHAAIMRRYSNHANFNILLERGDFPRLSLPLGDRHLRRAASTNADAPSPIEASPSSSSRPTATNTA